MLKIERRVILTFKLKRFLTFLPYNLHYINKLTNLAVADHIPLKQGLRHFQQTRAPPIWAIVADHIPLKQGLRLISSISLNFSWLGSQTIFH